MRVPNGVHRDRLSLILAVLSKHTAIKPFSVNIHTNVVGGQPWDRLSMCLASDHFPASDGALPAHASCSTCACLEQGMLTSCLQTVS